jgi:uncharacterized membrane protein (DUF485 family)
MRCFRQPWLLSKEEQQKMDQQRLSRIVNDPRFQELVAKRSRYAWTLAVVMLAIYYGFILVIAFAPAVLGQPLAPGAVTTVGIPVGIVIIVAAFVLTGLYVRRANSEFDALNQKIIEGSK